MQDPSFGVPTHLAQHVHLVSNYNFPFAARLSLAQAFEILYKAPQIVKQHATMSWKYFSAPPKDGETFLTWISPRYNDQYPGDGYIWAGPEERAYQEMNGYTIEIAVQPAGFAPRQDALANHRRARYRLVQKNPNVNAPPPDRNLWLVHYGSAEPQRVLQPSQINMSRLQQVQLAQRSQIDLHGPLEQNQFMLHDRDRWPVLKGGRPGSQGVMMGQGGPPPGSVAHIANPRFGGQHYQQQSQAAVGPSPAKRQRTSMTAVPPAAPQLPEYHDLDAEDEYALGDYLDTLSQRDVSKARYIQHHEWMEEVFASPYANSQIEPVYLGFGLMGELAGLTKGVFETVEKAARQYQENAGADDQLVVPAKVTPDQVQDFEKKVNVYLNEGQAEIKKMKEEHTKKMEEWRRGKAIGKAEKRLRNARWAGESPQQVRLSGFTAEQESSEKVDDIVKEVETAVGLSIVSKAADTLVERGGLKDKVIPPTPEPAANGTMDHVNGNEDVSRDQTGSSQPMQSQPPPLQQPGLQAQPPAQQIPPPQQQVGGPPQQQHPPSQSAAPPTMPPAAQPSIEDTNMEFPTDDQLDTMDTSNFEMADIDMDIGDETEFNFNDTLDTSTPQATSNPAPLTEQAPAPAVPAAQSQANQPAAAPSVPQQSLDPNTAAAAGAAGAAAAPSQPHDAADLSFHPTPGDNSAFDEFTAGDGFVDFGDGEDGMGDGAGPAGTGETPGAGIDLDLGLEESAFGDAFHGSLGGSAAGTPGQGGGGEERAGQMGEGAL